MSLEKELTGWQGKSVQDICDIHDRHVAEPSYGRQLADLLRNERLQRGASWLLKHHLSQKGRLDDLAVNVVFSSLTSLEHWESRLHFLQCLEYMPIPARHADELAAFLRTSMSSDRPFVRAWAISGFHQLAQQYPIFEPEEEFLFNEALKDGAGSVTARVRTILKKKDRNKNKNKDSGN